MSAGFSPSPAEPDRRATPEIPVSPERAAVAPAGAKALAQHLADVGGPSVKAVLLYGSHLLDAAPDRYSAYDLVVVVQEYRDFYRRLSQRGELHRPPWLMTAVAHVLPPNVIAYEPDQGRAGIAKCLVLREDHFRSALTLPPPDHFVVARMVQKVAMVWARDDAVAERVSQLLTGARRGVPVWVGPFLDAPFTARSLGRTMLDVCYRAEIRPEAADRATVVFDAQEEYFEDAFEPVLQWATRRGLLESRADGYRFAVPPGARSRMRWRLHFLKSKIRVTARWLKHVITFDKWLPYVRRKVERRTGVPVELTALERRLPLIFLWPRLIRVLRALPATEGKPGRTSPSRDGGSQDDAMTMDDEPKPGGSVED